MAENVAEVRDGGLKEGALAGVEPELVLGEEVEDSDQVLCVFLVGGAVDAEVVDEDSNIGKVREESLHVALHVGGGVGQAKRHDEELELARVSDERGLLRLSEFNLPEGGVEVKGAEDGGAAEAGDHLWEIICSTLGRGKRSFLVISFNWR